MPVALAMLARRALPSARVRERLLRSFDAADVDSVVARLAELGLLDDGAYAERFVRDRFERGGYGRERIRADLCARGLPWADIDAAIAAVIDDERERERAERALTRFRSVKAGRTDSRRLRERAFRHLVGRGFPVELVRDLLRSSL